MSAGGPGALRGLPGPLPAGERVVWQGAPQWRALAVHAFHVRKVAIYFAVLLTWFVASGAPRGADALMVAGSVALFVGLAAVPPALIALYAWLTARTTVYTVTDRRLVVRFGIALPATVNIPFARIESAGLRLFADGTGDIPLTLVASERIAYFLLWPHVRPWRMKQAQPMLRAVPDAQAAAQTLARALAASADLAVPVGFGESAAGHGRAGVLPAAA